MYEKLYTYINVQLIHRFFFKNYTFKYYSAHSLEFTSLSFRSNHVQTNICFTLRKQVFFIEIFFDAHIFILF